MSTVALALRNLSRVALAALIVLGPCDAAAIEREAPALADFDLDDLMEVRVVDIASRREQSEFDAPATIAVITADDIEAEGFASVPEVLRRVPGVYVIQTNSNTFNVGLRGYNGLANDHAILLIDGRSVGDLSQGFVAWGALPLHPGDIERIEVLRGAGTTLFGANAVSGVINIITKRPLDHDGLEAMAAAGTYAVPENRVDGGTRRWVHNSGSGYAAMHWRGMNDRLGGRVTLGFHGDPEADEPAARVVPVHGSFGYNAAASGEYRGEAMRLYGRLAHVQAENDHLLSTVDESIYLETAEQSLTLQWRRERLLDDRLVVDVQVDGRRLESSAQLIVGSGETDDQTVSNYAGHGLAKADLTLLGGDEVFTLGAEASWHRTNGLFDIDYRARYAALLAENTLVLLDAPRLSLNLGARFEQITTTGGRYELTYRNVNPRGSLVANFDDLHSVRLSVATAYRTPTPFENLTTVDYAGYPEPAPRVAVVQSNPRLEPSQAASVELGYQARWVDGVRTDVVAYGQRVLGVAKAPLERRVPVQATNVGDSEQLGIVGRIEYAHSRDNRVFVHYAHTLTRDAETGVALDDWPRHLAGIGTRIGAVRSLRIDSSLFYASAIAPRELMVEGMEVAPGTVQTAPQVIWNLRLAHAVLGGHGELYLSGRNLISFVRDRADLVQYAALNAEPVGASILLGVRFDDGGDR